MDFKNFNGIGLFMIGVAVTLCCVYGFQVWQSSEIPQPTLPGGEGKPELVLQGEQTGARYSSYISGNETRYGGANIKDTEITGNLTVHGGLTAYNVKAYAATINGGATLTNGIFRDVLTVHGGIDGRNIHAHALKIFGAATLHNTTIDATVNVHGGLDARGLKARAVQIHGAATIIDATLSEQLRITGKTNLSNSEVPEIVLYTSPISWVFGLFSTSQRKPVLIITNSHVGAIIVNTDDNDGTKIRLSQDSIVEAITFNGKPGTVIIDETSSVDSVVNGTVQAAATV